MTRYDVYESCTEDYYQEAYGYGQGVHFARELLPPKAIDAIIDCAVEEAIAIMKVKESEGK